jgi:hypothetical protein
VGESEPVMEKLGNVCHEKDHCRATNRAQAAPLLRNFLQLPLGRLTGP